MCGRLEACGELAARQSFQLKDDIEIGREATPSLAEEEPVGRVGDIVVKSLRVDHQHIDTGPGGGRAR
jgi:hypothetical protein